jgi:hypothetical protein
VTDDLVKQLRSLAEEEFEMLNNVHEPVQKAADRIEQLEEVMRWVLGTIGHDHPAKKVIRAALGEKKDA